MVYKIITCSILLIFLALAATQCGNARNVVTLPEPPKVKDVIISNGLCARLYVPNKTLNRKLSFVIFYHGGDFKSSSAYDADYNHYVISLVKKAYVIVLSVSYRLTTTVPFNTTFDDSWAALKWVATHSNGTGPDEWLNCFVNFNRVFLSGVNTGATISHNMVMRMAREKIDGLCIAGLALIHPYFWGSKPIGTKEPRDLFGRLQPKMIWMVANKMRGDIDDFRVNPLVDPKFSTLGCKKVIVFIGKGDVLYRDKGYYYYEMLRVNGWKGKAEIMETPGEHCFFLNRPYSKDAQDMLQRASSFYNTD